MSPRQGAGSTFLSAAAVRGEDRLPLSAQVTGTREERHLSLDLTTLLGGRLGGVASYPTPSGSVHSHFHCLALRGYYLSGPQLPNG